ncbi:hypothetical protein IPF37_00030 [bacterium]|nr:MAG: hypothetical protein IPF37_00030 [bacterium]
MKKISLLLITIGLTTAVMPAQNGFMEPVDTIIKQYQGYFDDSYETCTANQWFWEKWFGPHCEPNTGTADQKAVEINQHVEKLTKQIKIQQDVELDTTREKKELADYNKLATCINDQKPTTKRIVEFFQKIRTL